MLDGNFFEGFSAGCLPPGGEDTPNSSGEDLDLREDSRECLAAGSLEMSCSLPSTVEFGCWGPGGWWAFSALSSVAFLQTDLTEPPPAFLESRVVLPRSVDRRVSFCLRADLKKDSPLSSNLPSRFRPDLRLVLGERRLATEELRMCLPSPRPSPALAWLPRGELGLELEVTLALSETRLCREPSRLRFWSEVLLLPTGKGPRGVGPEAFLAGVAEVDLAEEEADFCFCSEGEDAESWDLGELSFLGWEGAGDECRPPALEEASALLPDREDLRETFTGTGEDGDVLEREDSWLAKTGLPFRRLLSTSEAPLEAGGFLAVLSGFFVREPGWLGGFASLTGELSTESL